MKQKSKPPKRHHERDLSRAWPRNAGPGDHHEPVDHLFIPAPILGPSSPTDPSSMALVRYDPRAAAARVPRASLTRRAAAKVRAKAEAAVEAVKPNVVNPINGPHLLQVAAGAGGGLAASLAARQFGDDLGEKKLAGLLIALGSAGAIFLDKNWQRIAAGILASGMGQLSSAYLTERAEAKLAKEHKLRLEAERAAIRALQVQPAAAARAAAPATAPAPATPPRNAYGFIDDGADVYRAVDRAHRAVDGAYPFDERNGYPLDGDGAIDVDLADAYAYAAAA